VFYTVPAEREMTVQDLLRHTSGLPYGARGTSRIHAEYPASSSAAARELTGTEFIDRLAKAPLLHQPGSNWEYGFSSDVLAAWWRSSRQDARAVFSRSASGGRCACRTPASWCRDKHARLAAGFATDPDTGKPSRSPTQDGAEVECGGGCAVSTAGDYIRFGQMLANRGILDGTRRLGARRWSNDRRSPGHRHRAGTDYIPARAMASAWLRRAPRGRGCDLNGSAATSTGRRLRDLLLGGSQEELVVVSMTQAPGPIPSTTAT
jgi:CubicO group peptidase (beta-lactamase class C family)